jgi:hypothetical protein
MVGRKTHLLSEPQQLNASGLESGYPIGEPLFAKVLQSIESMSHTIIAIKGPFEVQGIIFEWPAKRIEGITCVHADGQRRGWPSKLQKPSQEIDASLS